MSGEDADQPVVGLEDFARLHMAGRRHRRWIDQLSDEVVEQIAASQTPPSVVIAWLESLGFEGATPSKIKPLMDLRRRRD